MPGSKVPTSSTIQRKCISNRKVIKLYDWEAKLTHLHIFRIFIYNNTNRLKHMNKEKELITALCVTRQSCGEPWFDSTRTSIDKYMRKHAFHSFLPLKLAIAQPHSTALWDLLEVNKRTELKYQDISTGFLFLGCLSFLVRDRNFYRQLFHSLSHRILCLSFLNNTKQSI